ncbi:uncharacterized protein EI90DRAFT_3011625 [Cantharellus anzutake]|uniref:uncharacterized protein n=1 Tax=Cantharellus anzutake TaxID=1750568 RepID=UPI0019069F20|nr:uncharacterized protein EI90DRAFT_3011625 [Cantharellus anzutake]KAF8342070.1 hypothetical protein EI90DRAFT_3011625 [Cantharellus anzutake]
MIPVQPYDLIPLQDPRSMIHDPTQPDKPGSLIVASRKTSFLLSFLLAAQLEPVSPSTPRGSPIETDPDLPSLTSTSTGSLDLSSEQLGILTAAYKNRNNDSTHQQLGQWPFPHLCTSEVMPQNHPPWKIHYNAMETPYFLPKICLHRDEMTVLSLKSVHFGSK